MMTAAVRQPLKKAAWFLLLLSLVLSSGSVAYPQGFDLDKWHRGFYLAASAKNAVLLVRTSKTEGMQLLLVDFASGKQITLKSQGGAHLLSPYLSPDGRRLLFSRQLAKREGNELVSCNTESLACRIVFRVAGSLHSAIELSDNRILYVSSPYYKSLDGRVRLNRNDIWVYEPKSGPRQLTNFSSYELDSLSVTQDQIYFSAYGPSPKQRVIPEPASPFAEARSEIFHLPLDLSKVSIEMPSGTLTPLFASAGIANYPATSADGSLVAFLRTRTNISPYHYNLVIADQTNGSERLIETAGMGSSRPVIVDHDVYACVVGDDRTLIQVYRRGESSMKTLAEINDASIARAEVIELTIAP